MVKSFTRTVSFLLENVESFVIKLFLLCYDALYSKEPDLRDVFCQPKRNKPKTNLEEGKKHEI